MIKIIQKNFLRKVKKSFGTMVSIFVALVSLVVAYNSLTLSERVYTLSSRDFIPQIEFEFIENGVKVHNKTNDLFQIKQVNVLEVAMTGFIENNNDSYVQIPLVYTSHQFDVYDDKEKSDEFVIDFNSPTSCAYVCEFDNEMFQKVQDRIQQEYGIDSEKGFAAPYLQEGFSVLEVGYTDKFKSYKTVIYKYQHIHGVGTYTKYQMSSEEFNETLKEINVQEFDNFEDQWNYLIKSYRKQGW